ncbi:acyltransferase family protein [Janibacter limosus]|uniref:acyltransferase family protein n=1 Tax=Janibacter limosus TaxID=53458 RepID=UPI0013EEC4B8|nr:acyltransferase [Janibacter limosus]
MTAGPSARTYWPGLDGLRGIAALAVIIFHAGLGPAVNGYVGVDVFFALSGFLITSLLLVEAQRHGRIRLLRFYTRRMLRLWPALVATCILVIAAAAATGQLSEAAPGTLAVLFYLGNWWMYTGRSAPLLDHTWTLAIEEHFYAVWPVLLIGLCSRRRALRAFAVIAAVVGVALIFTPWPEPITDVRGTYLRGFPIIWGSLLAWVVSRRREATSSRALGTIGNGALLVLLGVLLIPWTLPERWLTGPSSGTGILSLFVLAGIVLSPRSAAATLLAWPPLRWAGTRSYGLYLYHFPVLQVLRHHVQVGPEWFRMVVGIMATIIIAEASFRWLEAPFLRLKDRLGRHTASVPNLPLGPRTATDSRG